ncbi:MAG: hypothetical protein CL763_08565 [Chloroflexi bacterium]|nr:hypothetical protein [Chloroflexota bacterium]|tara:strand:+ start:23545 stop:24282 length:738 start_codon:yes stop_codon:yes gene_type:complete
MKVIILAAGKGTRLGNYTNDIPKALVDVNGTSIIERQLKQFQKNGITDISIIVGYKKEKFSLKNVNFIYNDNFENNDLLASLIYAEKEICGEILILFADLLFEEKILEQIIKSTYDISIAIDLDWKKKHDDKRNNQFPPLAEIEDNKVVRISEKKSLIRKKPSGEFFGIMKLSSHGSCIFMEILEQAKSHQGHFHDSNSFSMAKITDMIQEIIENGYDIKPIFVNGKWLEVDTIMDLEKAKIMFQ